MKQVDTVTNKSEKRTVLRKAEYNLFIEFMAVPRAVRKDVFGFVNEGEFAKKYNLSQDTLTDWKEIDGFWDQVLLKLSKWGHTRSPDVMGSLLKNIIQNGNAAEVKLWWQIIEEWEEKIKNKLDFDGANIALVEFIGKDNENKENKD